MSTTIVESKACSVCSTPLEKDGLCLVCLLSEGIDAAEEAPEEALKLGRETAALALQAPGERHALTGCVYGRLAKHCRDAGLIDESIQHGRRSLHIYWHTVGPEYVKANATLDALAETLEKPPQPLLSITFKP